MLWQCLSPKIFPQLATKSKIKDCPEDKVKTPIYNDDLHEEDNSPA